MLYLPFNYRVISSWRCFNMDFTMLCFLMFQALIDLIKDKRFEYKTTESCHVSAYLTFHSVPNHSAHISISPRLQGDESRDWSAFPAGNERASLRGLFKQHVIYGYRVVPGQPFTWLLDPHCLPRSTWVIVPHEVPISEVFSLHATSKHYHLTVGNRVSNTQSFWNVEVARRCLNEE